MREITKNLVIIISTFIIIVVSIFLGIILFLALGLREYYYNGNFLKILAFQNPLYSASNLINMLVAAGTLTLAFVAYLQIKQNEKFRIEEKKEKQKEFNKKKKAIYLILVSIIEINIKLMENLNFLNIEINPDNFFVLIELDNDDKIRLNSLKRKGEYNSFLRTEAVYFTINAIDTVNNSINILNSFIDSVNEARKKDYGAVDFMNFAILNIRYYMAIINSFICIITLIQESNVITLISKDFIERQIKTLDNIKTKIENNKKKILEYNINKKIELPQLSIDHSRYLKDIEGLTLIFSNYLNEKI